MSSNKIQLPSGALATITDLVSHAPILDEQLRWLVTTASYNGSNSSSLESISARFRVVIRALRYVVEKLDQLCFR